MKRIVYYKSKRMWQHISILLLGLLIYTNLPSDESEYKTIKTVKKETILDTKPSIKYISPKKIKKNLKETDSIKVKDYKFKIDTIYKIDKGTIRFQSKGWGNLEDIKIDTEIEESIVYKPSNGLFLSGEYVTPILKNSGLKDLYKVNLDYQIKNKVIIGASIGLMDRQPMVGLKLGLKL